MSHPDKDPATKRNWRVYKCIYCDSENLFVTGYEDGGGDYGDDVTEVLQCEDCGASMPEDQAFWGWETDDDSPEDGE